MQADLTNDGEIEDIVGTAATHGSFRHLATIAGMQHIDSIESFPMGAYDTIHDVMLRAPLYFTKLYFPPIREINDGIGCVGNMTSIHGHEIIVPRNLHNFLNHYRVFRTMSERQFLVQILQGNER